MSFLSEFLEFLLERKKFWLLPIIFVLVLMGGLIVLTQGSAVAPFNYTLFWANIFAFSVYLLIIMIVLQHSFRMVRFLEQSKRSDLLE